MNHNKTVEPLADGFLRITYDMAVEGSPWDHSIDDLVLLMDLENHPRVAQRVYHDVMLRYDDFHTESRFHDLEWEAWHKTARLLA